MNTRIRYRYTAGRRRPTDLVLIARGRLTRRSRTQILGALADQWFLPGQVGLPDLLPDKIDGDDHPWHELLELGDTLAEPTTTWRTDQLAATFAAVRRWDEPAARKRLGITQMHDAARTRHRILGDEEELLTFLMVEEDLGIY